jgi:hypothetical protein
MKTYWLPLFVSIVLAALSACETTVDLDLDELENRIALEGYVMHDSLPYIRVSRTAEYLDNSPTPIVSNAFVTIEDETGRKDTLQYSGSNGVYVGDSFWGIKFRTYTMKAIVDGQTYTAVAYMDDLPEPDSISYIYNPGNAFQEEGFYPILFAKSPAEGTAFLFKFYRNDSLLTGPTEVWAFDGKFTDGDIDGIATPYVYQFQDTAAVIYYSLDRSAFDFWSDLSLQLTSDGGFFSTPPANARTNWDNGGLGIFQASTAREIGIKIE